MQVSTFYSNIQKRAENSNVLSGRKRSEFVKSVVGLNYVRIFPWDASPDVLPEHLREAFTLTDDKGQVILAEDGTPEVYVPFFLPYRSHSINGELITCPMSFGEDCPICSEGTKAWRVYKETEDEGTPDKALKEYAKKYFAREMYLSMVIHTTEREHLDDLYELPIRPFSYSRMIWKGFIGLITETNPESGDLERGDITDRETGRICTYKRTGTGRVNTRYDTFKAFDSLSPIPEGVDAPDLYTYLQEKLPYDEAKAAKALDSLRVGPDEFVEEEIPVPSSEEQSTSSKEDTNPNTAKIDALRNKLKTQQQGDEVDISALDEEESEIPE